MWQQISNTKLVLPEIMLEDQMSKFLRNPENCQNSIICSLDHDHFWKISLKSVHSYFGHIKQMAAVILPPPLDEVNIQVENLVTSCSELGFSK